jgi:tetratricopeptide (TPR) repeat protein
MVSAASVGGSVRRGLPASLAFAVIMSSITAQSLAQDGKEWVGQRVVTKFGAVLRVGKQVVDDDALANSGSGMRNHSRIYRVEQESGRWLWLHDEKLSTAGWLTADWVVPIDLAIDYFTDEIRAHRNTAAAYIGRGYIWRDKKEYDIAIADYGDAIRLDPTDALAFNGRGVAWLAKKEYDKAIADLSEAIRQNPKFARAYVDRGNVWYEQSDNDRALADYSEAVRRDPRNAIAYYDRGNTWYVKKEYDQAMADFDQAIQLDPRDASSFIGRGNCQRAKNQNEKALADFTEALRLDPENASAYLSRGDVWSARHDYDKAITDYRQALRFDSRLRRASDSNGYTAYNNHEFAKAIAYFDETLRVNPKDSNICFYRSVAQMILHRGEAAGGFKTILGLDEVQPPYPTYALILGHFAARLTHDDAEAKALLARAPGKLDVNAWPYPVVKVLRGEIDEQALLEAATDDEKRTDAGCFLGLLHLLACRKDQALAHFRWVREHGNPAFYEYAIAVAELDRLDRR